MISSASDLSRAECFLDDVPMADWQRLGKVVIARRVNRGYKTQGDFAKLLGLTTRVVGDIENGRRSNYDPATIATLERALGWETGSVDAVLAGGEPTDLRPSASLQAVVTLTAGGAVRHKDEIDLIAESETMDAREKLERIRLVLELRAQAEAEERARREARTSKDTRASSDHA